MIKYAVHKLFTSAEKILLFMSTFLLSCSFKQLVAIPILIRDSLTQTVKRKAVHTNSYIHFGKVRVTPSL